jgi:hypothetical protein
VSLQGQVQRVPVKWSAEWFRTLVRDLGVIVDPPGRPPLHIPAEWDRGWFLRFLRDVPLLAGPGVKLAAAQVPNEWSAEWFRRFIRDQLS